MLTATLKTRDYYQQFLPGESHGQMSLEGYGLWSHKELDMTEAIKQQSSEYINCDG